MKLLSSLLLLALLIVPAMAQQSYPRAVAASQVTVTTTATIVCPARTNRSACTIATIGTTAVFCGPATVTAANGFPIENVAYKFITVPGTAAVYCIVGAGSQAVATLETF